MLDLGYDKIINSDLEVTGQLTCVTVSCTIQQWDNTLNSFLDIKKKKFCKCVFHFHKPHLYLILHYTTIQAKMFVRLSSTIMMH